MPQIDTEKSSKTAIHDLGAAAFNLKYREFRAALELEDDDYAVDKYQQFKAIGRAMHAFSDTALVSLVEMYQASKARW